MLILYAPAVCLDEIDLSLVPETSGWRWFAQIQSSMDTKNETEQKQSTTYLRLSSY